MAYEDWCDLLSTIQVKDDRKRAANQINDITSNRAASLSDSNESVSIMRKNRARLVDGVICSNKVPHKKSPKHHVTQSYCVLCKKAGMTEQDYMLYSSEECTGMRTN